MHSMAGLIGKAGGCWWGGITTKPQLTDGRSRHPTTTASATSTTTPRPLCFASPGLLLHVRAHARAAAAKQQHCPRAAQQTAHTQKVMRRRQSISSPLPMPHPTPPQPSHPTGRQAGRPQATDPHPTTPTTRTTPTATHKPNNNEGGGHPDRQAPLLLRLRGLRRLLVRRRRRGRQRRVLPLGPALGGLARAERPPGAPGKDGAKEPVYRGAYVCVCGCV